jgi:hypothetical protein
VIPLPANGSLPSEDAATLLPVTGQDFEQTPGVANLNGIVAKSGVLIVAQSNTGLLFRVDPTTGIATLINLGDNVTLSNVDGLELQGRTLYAVRNTNVVTVVQLDSQLAAGTVLGNITDPGLDVPTTGTVAGRRAAVGSQRPVRYGVDAGHEVLDHPTAAAPRKRLRSTANQYRVPSVAPSLRGVR